MAFSVPLDNDEYHSDHDTTRSHGAASKDKAHIEIVLDKPFLALKGTGPDVELTRLSGNVILYLSEATSIKEVTLQFRGKARIPVPAHESLINNNTALTYVVCNHNWSFLEGSHKQSHTLKAGRHFFPFHLEVGGSLPSSIATPVLGGASIAYKLRAVAVRPRLAHNLQVMITVPIVRSFSHEALEYQQTLEIENEWHGKIMYSVVLPHKGWAMGDKIASLIKLSPLSKGIVVESILMNVVEVTKIFARSGPQEHTRVVASSRHDLIEGKPVLIEENKPWLVIGQHGPPSLNSSRTNSSPNISSAAHSSPLSPINIQPLPTPPATVQSSPFGSSTGLPAPIHRPAPAPHDSAFASSQTTGTTPLPSRPSSPDINSSDVVAALFLGLPDNHNIVPSHTLEPIVVSHRMRWSFYIRNAGGHISELRCSLPVVILDHRLLNEVRSNTRMTRRAVIAPGLENSAIETRDPLLMVNGEGEEDELEMEERELPAYDAHVRDRVANMYLPEAATMRITNPWVVHGTSPVSPNAGATGTSTPAQTGVSSGSFAEQQNTAPLSTGYLTPDGPVQGQQTTLETLNRASAMLNADYGRLTAVNSTGSLPPMQMPHLGAPYSHLSGNLSSAGSSRGGRSAGAASSSRPMSLGGTTSPLGAEDHVMAHLPHAPGSGTNFPLDWINCELMMSLSEDPRSRFGPTHFHGVPDGNGGTCGSRGPSRPGSPERGGSGRQSTRSGHDVESGGSSTGSDAVGHDKEHQHHGHGVGKGFGGFFKGAMKGLALTRHHGSAGSHHSHSGDHLNLPWATRGGSSSGHGHTSGNVTASHSPRPQPAAPSTSWLAMGLGMSPSHSQRPVGDRARRSTSSALHPPESSAPPLPPSLMLSSPTRSRATSPFNGYRPLAMSSSTSQLSSGQGHQGNHAQYASRLGGGGSTQGSLPATSGSGFLGSPSSMGSAPVGGSNDQMLHRAFTEVPDYSIAAKGFIGGVPPLSSMQGLPSYEESTRTARSMTSGGSVNGGGTGTGAAGGSGDDFGRRVVSEGELTRRFQGMGAVAGPSSAAGNGGSRSPRERTETEGSRSSEDGSSDGIHMRVKRRPV